MFPKIGVYTRKSKEFSLINHPFWGTIIFGNTQIPQFISKENFWFFDLVARMLQQKEQHHPSETCKQYRFLLSWPRLVRREYREASLSFFLEPFRAPLGLFCPRTGLFFCPTFFFWKKHQAFAPLEVQNPKRQKKSASIFFTSCKWVPPTLRFLPPTDPNLKTTSTRFRGAYQCQHVRIPYNLGVLGLNIWGWR